MGTPSISAAPVPWSEVAARAAAPDLPAGERIVYGTKPQQFGELRLPAGRRAGKGPFPVVVVIHGGCWRSEYDLGHVRPVSAALTAAGFATWTIEYRRLGDVGGGWPGTLDDVSRAIDALREIAATKPLDLSRLVTLGHSAGGHLALWVAAARPGGLPVRGVVTLAAISDLARYGEGTKDCNAASRELVGKGAVEPEELAARLAASSPIERLPLGVSVRLVHGSEDPIVPFEQSERYAEAARANGDDARVTALPGAGHFDLIAPWSAAWKAVLEAVRELTSGPLTAPPG